MNDDPQLSQALEKAMREAADRLLAEHIMTEQNFARASLAYRLNLWPRARHEFGTDPCLKPRPFLRSAIEEARPAIAKIIRTAIKRSIDR